MPKNYASNLVDVLSGKVDEIAKATEGDQVKAILLDAISKAEELTAPAYYGDRLVYRITVGTLGAAVLLVVAAQFCLALLGADIPDGIISIGSAAIGALAGLLAPTSSAASNGNPKADG